MIFDFNGAFTKALIKETGRDMSPTYTSWDWDTDAGWTPEESKRTWLNHIHTSNDFWIKLKPVPEAKNVVRQLNRLEREGHGVYFISARTSGIKPRVQTEIALYDLGMNYPAVILSTQKAPLLKSLEIEFFIDDRLDTMLDLKGEHYYLLDAPWNRVGRPDCIKVVGTVEEGMRRANLWLETK